MSGDEEHSVDADERLSAYAAGELTGPERSALEDELARDPAMRERLARIRTLDTALSGLAPVEPPAGFSQRLREAVAGELDRTPLPGDGVDELASRRARSSRWWYRTGIAAAAAAVIGIAGVGATLLFGGDDAVTGGTPTLDAMAGGADAPITVSDRDYTAAEVEALTDSEPVRSLAPGDVSEARAQQLEEERRLAFGAADTGGESAPAPAAEGRADAPEGAEGAPPAEPAPQNQALPAGVPEDAAADVRRCLPPLLDGDATVIPLRAEVARYEGEPAVLYVLSSRDPDTGGFDRVEVWVTARSDCQVLLFAQSGP